MNTSKYLKYLSDMIRVFVGMSISKTCIRLDNCELMLRFLVMHFNLAQGTEGDGDKLFFSHIPWN